MHSLVFSQAISKADTVFFAKDTRLMIADSLWVFDQDTTLIFDRNFVNENPDLKNYVLYRNIEQKANKSLITRELYKLAVSSSPDSFENDSVGKYKAEEPFVPFKGLIIRHIRYQIVDAIGSNDFDTTSIYRAKLSHWMNKTYPVTKTFVVKNNLLFDEGEALDPLELSNSERFLREQKAFKDARIVVTELANNPDSVDIIVIAKDKYPFGVGFNAMGIDKYQLSLYTVNFRGWGQYLNNAVTVSTSESPFLKYSNLDYQVPNIAGSFVDANLVYDAGDDHDLMTLQANRAYMPHRSSIGGSAKLERFKYSLSPVYDYPPENNEDSTKNIPVGYHEGEAVLGYSKLLNPASSAAGRFLVLSGRYIQKDFFERPTTSPDTNIRYQNRSDYLVAVSYLRNNFYQSRYINNFGITEDVPYGINITLTGGYELAEFFNRPYLGLSFSVGNFVPRIGYVYFMAELGSFFWRDQLKQGLFAMEFRYFTKLLNLKNDYKSRVNFWFYYAAGLNRFKNENMFVLNTLRGRNFDLFKYEGNQQMNMNVSYLTFTPLNYFGFKFAFEFFVDAALVGPASKAIWQNSLLTGFGAAIKIKNENLVFGTIELRFAYFPQATGDERKFGFRASVNPTESFPGFEAGKPEIIPYHLYYLY
jgi:hypothetical protein